MNDSNLPQMADILMPLTHPDSGLAWQAIALLMAILIAGFISWRSMRTPCTRLAGKLKRGELNPREAAHRLAHLPHNDSSLDRELDHLRFRCQPPDKQTVLEAIEKVARGP